MSGELPKAFIVLKPGVAKDSAVGRDILGYVKEKKIRYKWIKEVELIDAIPKSASGKILRKNLRKRGPDEYRGLVVKDEKQSKL
jgi:4-coumarate--CoA ligase